jgi:WD40 repeat protein
MATTTASPGGDDATPALAWGHPARVFDLAFSPLSSDVVASASEDGTARVWRRSADDPDLWKQVRERERE